MDIYNQACLMSQEEVVENPCAPISSMGMDATLQYPDVPAQPVEQSAQEIPTPDVVESIIPEQQNMLPDRTSQLNELVARKKELEKQQNRKNNRISHLVENEGYAGTLKGSTELGKLTDTSKKSRKIKGTSKYGLYYDSEGRLTSGIGHLITSKDDLNRHMNQTEEDAYQRLNEDIDSHDRDLDDLLVRKGIDSRELSEDQIDGLRDASFQLGSKLGNFNKMFKAIKDRKYEEAAKEAKRSDWYKQTPDRVEDLQKKIVVNDFRGPIMSKAQEEAEKERLRVMQKAEKLKTLQDQKAIQEAEDAVKVNTGLSQIQQAPSCLMTQGGEINVAEYAEGGIAPLGNHFGSYLGELDKKRLEDEALERARLGMQEELPEPMDLPPETLQPPVEEEIPELLKRPEPTPTIKDPLAEKEDKSGHTTTEKAIEKSLPGSKELLKQARTSDNLDVQDEYRALLSEYKQAFKEKDKARKLHAMLGITKAIAQFGAQYGAGQAAVAGRMPIATPKVQMDIPKVEDLIKGPTTKDLESKMKLYKALKGDKPTTRPYQQSKLVNEKGDPVIFDGNIGKYVNPMTGAVETGKLKPRHLQIYTDPETKEKFRITPDGETYKISNVDEDNMGASTKVYYKMNQNEKELLDKSTDKFAQETRDQRDSIEKLKGLSNFQIDKAVTNEISASHVGAQVATIYENGRLTDEDVLRYTRRKSIVSRLQDYHEELLSGTINQDKADEIKDALRVYQKALKMALNDRAKEKYESLRGRFKEDYNRDDVMRLIYGNYEKGESSNLEPNEKLMKDKKSGKFVVVDKETNKPIRWAK